MIPISDSVQVRRPAWITFSLVTICVAVFLYELTLPSRALDLFIQKWGANPHLILLALAGDARVPRTELLTLFTSQFLHGGWIHLLGNMLFLWVFGRAVEDRFGHLLYLAIYLLGGAGAGIVQSWVGGGHLTLALIGASGAIATILGVYLVSYPRAWVRVLVPILFFFWFFDVPAIIMLALWFFGQFFTGIAFITQAAAPGNVAVWAHVGGFLIGVVAGLVVPRSVGGGAMGRQVERRTDGPGPAGLISSVANLAALALVARILLLFLDVRPGPSLVGQIANVAYAITNPIVWPFEEFIPWVAVAGRPLDLPAVVVMAFILVAANSIVRSMKRSNPARLSGRPSR